jgi:hypothetical protein
VPQVSREQIRSRLAAIDVRKAHFEQKSNTPPERLARHEVWRHDYLSYPYLIGVPDDRVGKRFRDIFMNVTELGPDAKIGVHDFQKDDTLTQKFMHMLEEYGSRSGGPPIDVVAAARAPVVRYFENGDPVAVKLFAGYQPPPAPFLVKYGRKEFLEPTLHEGRIRICPAAYYNDAAHIHSVQDDETRRTFFIPTFRERLEGKDFIEFQGHKLVFDDDDIVIPVICRDYFLFSLCDQIYYRLPTDFNADAACAEAIAQGVHSADVVLNILARQRDPTPPANILTPAALTLRHAPTWLRRNVFHPCEGGPSSAPYTWRRWSSRSRCRA